MTGPVNIPGHLSSILGSAGGLTAPRETTARLPVASLVPGAHQPRRHFDEAALASLADSIREKGVLTPLLVRPLGNGRSEIIAGERRWRAAQLAGLSEVPVVSRPLSDDDAQVLALMDNLQREDLSPFDEIEGKARLVAAALGIPPEQAPTRLNENIRNPVPEDVAVIEPLFRLLGRETWQSFAKNKLRVLGWPAPLVEALRAGMVLGTASLIAGADEAHQAELIELWRQGQGRAEIAAAKERLSRRPPPDRAKQVGKFLASRRMQTLSPGAAEQVQQWLAQMPRELAALLEE